MVAKLVDFVRKVNDRSAAIHSRVDRPADRQTDRSMKPPRASVRPKICHLSCLVRNASATLFENIVSTQAFDFTQQEEEEEEDGDQGVEGGDDKEAGGAGESAAAADGAAGVDERDGPVSGHKRQAASAGGDDGGKRARG